MMSMLELTDWYIQPSDTTQSEKLRQKVRNVLKHAFDAYQNDLKVYASLSSLNDVIGTEYGDRVLYELIQNAHDAHQPGAQGRIAVSLNIHSKSEGTLYVANGGNGFRSKDLDAIMNLATSAKEIGESIGNKGLGFRSVEALTNDVQIYSRCNLKNSNHFDGYCFRFAKRREIEELLNVDGLDDEAAKTVAQTVPRYLVPLPLTKQPDDISSYALRGYSSVIVLPLSTAESIDLAQQQIQALAELDVPLLLFLDRIADFRIEVSMLDMQMFKRRLSRRQKILGTVPSIPDCCLLEVSVGENRRFLVVQRRIKKSVIRDAVKKSISRAPQIKRWEQWKGQPMVSVAVGLSPDLLEKGRIYNFLPMGEMAVAPLLGYLDAPFFANINRRDANFELPFNETLMIAAAETCAHAALYLVKNEVTNIAQSTIFDLIAWTGNHAQKLDAALNSIGNSISDAHIIPIVEVDGIRWDNLKVSKLWPKTTYSLMKPLEVAKRSGAKIVSAEINGERLCRLQDMADRKFQTLKPTSEKLAKWSESFAQYLANQKVDPRIWSLFYEDLKRVFETSDRSLNALTGKSIILDQSRKLCPAGGNYDESNVGPFVHQESTRHHNSKGGAPLPPSNLTLHYNFVDEKIKFEKETLNAFIDAKLVREYHPLEILVGLGNIMGKSPNNNCRREALTWAFRVYQTVGKNIKNELLAANLHVLTSSGWKPATEAAFSSSWTSLGQILENYLVSTADKSPDCHQALDALLVDFKDWPNVSGGSKKQWSEFLMLLGVIDGLRPVAATLQNENEGRGWNFLLSNGQPKQGLDDDWCREVMYSEFNHPYTLYKRKGEAWRLPGQIEHSEFSGNVKEFFNELAFKHLEAYGDRFLKFEVGRFERDERNWDKKSLPTPLATFLRSKDWVAISTDNEPQFINPRYCWASRTKRNRLPRFIERISDTILELFQNSEELSELVMGEELGILDWNSPNTAVKRLQALATIASSLSSSERSVFRNEYRRAWVDVLETDAELPHDLDLAVIRERGPQLLKGNPEKAPTVIVVQNAQESIARLLSSTGHALLDVGDTSVESVVELLTRTGAFSPRKIDSVGLLVDGVPFVPSSSDPFLTSLDLGWLTEVVLLGHEFLAETLERGVKRETVERRVRALRVRKCQSISLVVDGNIVPFRGAMNWYGYEHTELPTLILSKNVELTWRSLSGDLSGTIQRLLDRRFRFLETLLLRLCHSQIDVTSLNPPSDEDLAAALRCDVATLQDHRAVLLTDIGHLLYLLKPVVAYFWNVDLAQQLETDAERGREQFDVFTWLKSLPSIKYSPAELISICERVPNRTDLLRELELDYGRFNQVLLKLNEAPLSNVNELRSMYEAYLTKMRPVILDRLRRFHVTEFRKGYDLEKYIERKSLKFLKFNPEWVLTREKLNKEIVESHVAKLMDEKLGQDKELDLPPFKGLLEKNRKSVRDFASQAFPIVITWCHRNEVAVPELWRIQDTLAITNYLEDKGYLDFDRIQVQQIPTLCHRANCWPEGMAQTLENKELGLNRSSVEESTIRHQEEQENIIIEKRSINFAGAKLDPSAKTFPEKFLRMAERKIANDESWLERSRKPNLADVDDLNNSSRQGSSKKGQRRQQPPEDQRFAMGVVSEWLVYQYLLHRFGDFVDESCWISRNRTCFFGGDEGNDSAGFDFHVNTPKTEWLFEVKSSLAEPSEFVLTSNEIRLAASVKPRGHRQYRILYVPFVFLPDRWMVLELPNPFDIRTRNRFKQVGRGSIRFRFETSIS